MTSDDTEPGDDATADAGPEPRPEPPPGSRRSVQPRLVRTREDRVIAGVCGGLARYLGVDPVFIRIAALLLVFAGGAGAVLYVIGWIAMPEEPAVVGGVPLEGTSPREQAERPGGAFVLGMVFVALGLFFLLDAVWGDFLAWKYVWPIALIAVGAAILLRPRR